MSPSPRSTNAALPGQSWLSTRRWRAVGEVSGALAVQVHTSKSTLSLSRPLQLLAAASLARTSNAFESEAGRSTAEASTQELHPNPAGQVLVDDTVSVKVDRPAVQGSVIGQPKEMVTSLMTSQGKLIDLGGATAICFPKCPQEPTDSERSRRLCAERNARQTGRARAALTITLNVFPNSASTAACQAPAASK